MPLFDGNYFAVTGGKEDVEFLRSDGDGEGIKGIGILESNLDHRVLLVGRLRRPVTQYTPVGVGAQGGIFV